MATQRSSFLLWEASTLAPVTPLVSWQDTRAAAWCSSRREAESWVRRRTGLVLSPHYVGPKLASLWGERPDLRRRAGNGELRFGTLDTYFAILISGGELHVMDPTQAQRTSLWNLDDEDWDEDLLHFFDVPRSLLPSVGPGPWRHQRGEILAMLADQSAAALGLDHRAAPCLVNLGTGGFVLSRTASRPRMGSGLLLSHLGKRGERVPWMAEGTINGIATSFSLTQAPDGSSRGDESEPEFGLPDFGAVGAPWWRPGVGPLFSPRGSRLTGEDFRMILAQGLAFRVREILESLPGNGSILLSGGLSRDAHIREALRRCISRSFLVADDPELTLRGLLVTCGVSLPPLLGILMPPEVDTALDLSFASWRRWVRRALG
ncbi:MAG: FGGY family carbohydrate kinase [Planctomycetota bacterium]